MLLRTLGEPRYTGHGGETSVPYALGSAPAGRRGTCLPSSTHNPGRSGEVRCAGRVSVKLAL